METKTFQCPKGHKLIQKGEYLYPDIILTVENIDDALIFKCDGHEFSLTDAIKAGTFTNTQADNMRKQALKQRDKAIGRNQNVKVIEDKPGTIGGFTLLPAREGTCPECATAHMPEMPHNQQSLYYQYHFYADNKRFPTWDDAMAHCTNKVKDLWMRELSKQGVTGGMPK